MGKLSVVISAFNEEDKIRDCLESIHQSADEIIFIDNSSTDKTAQIAKEYTSKIFARPNNPMLNVNKNFGFSKASGDWILSLDADERVTPELAEEIGKVISDSSIRQRLAQNDSKAVNGFWIPRKNIIFGKWMRHTGWYPDYQLRLFKEGKGKFPERHVHEMINVEGKTEKLIGHLEHLNYDNISQFLNKLTYIYTPNEAQNLLRNNYQFNYLDSIRMPAKEFINRFFAQQGYKDGLHGLVLSLLMAFYHLIVFVTIWEKKNFAPTDKISLISLQNETKKLGGELNFWLITARLNDSRNIWEKLLLKLQRKFL